MDKNSDANWMAGNYGLMVHYLLPKVYGPGNERSDDIDFLADNFDLDGFLEDFEATGAEWLIFTIGQNTGCYASPNSTLEEFAGPGHTTRRDLIFEIAHAVKQRGKRFIAYLPCEVSANTSLHKPLGWITAPGTNQAEFQNRYLEVIREWACRYGNSLDGWWFDGCYPWEVFHNSRLFGPEWVTAARAGNPKALLTFNDGCFVSGHTQPPNEFCDYLSGEACYLLPGGIKFGRQPAPYFPMRRQISDLPCQWHLLVPLDAFWMLGGKTDWLDADSPFAPVPDPERPAPMPEPVYPDDLLFDLVGRLIDMGGAVTLNAGIYADGRLGAATCDQLARLCGHRIRKLASEA